MAQILLKPIFKEAWAKVAGTKQTFFISFLALGLIQLALIGLDAYLRPLFPHAGKMMFLLNVVLFLTLCSPIITGSFMIGVRHARGQEIHSKQGFMYFKKTGSLFLASILALFTSWMAGFVFSFLMISLLRLLLSSSPAALITINIGFSQVFSFITLSLLPFSLIYVADQNQSPWQAYKNSIRTVLVYFKPITLALLFCFLFNLIAIIPAGIGFIWSLAFSQIVFGIVYREISQSNICQEDA